MNVRDLDFEDNTIDIAIDKGEYDPELADGTRGLEVFLQVL
jgi:hypothetical protein